MSEYRQQIETTDELAAWYDSKYSEMKDGWETPASECNKHLDDLGVPYDQEKLLLDVGCGAGHLLAEAQRRVHAEGVEISEKAIEYAYRRGVVKGTIGHASIEGDLRSLTGFDYIVSLGSLEHIVDLDQALDNIRGLLKSNGKFYFFCPNELWKHFDQPNERTMTDDEWIDLFARHGLYVTSEKRWNDNTAFVGRRGEPRGDHYVDPVTLPPNGNKLNIGSGQRRFDTGQGWINVDCVSRPPDQVPDLICDVGKEPLPYPDNSMDIAVLHQVTEHYGCNEVDGLVRECYRVLKPGCSLLIFVPDPRALAERWLAHQIDDYIYFVNLFGAFQGLESDRHRWLYTFESMRIMLFNIAEWKQIRRFDWRDISGANLANAWWVMAVDAKK